jgi:hypothetical protein
VHRDGRADYFALYAMRVAVPAVPETFSFHVPHAIGSAFLPAPQTLPRVKHVEQEGLFRFGRPLTPDEARFFTEAAVERALAAALADLDHMLAAAAATAPATAPARSRHDHGADHGTEASQGPTGVNHSPAEGGPSHASEGQTWRNQQRATRPVRLER